MAISFKKPIAKKVVAPPPPPPPPPADGPLDVLSRRDVREFYELMSKADAVIAAQNAAKRDLIAAYRKEFGPAHTDALKLACKLKAADPDKIAKHEAMTKEAAGYLAMLAEHEGEKAA